MLKIGLTGGIGSGKSTVARIFADLGVPIIDMDVLAREVVMPGQAALDEIKVIFGHDICDESDELDRKSLRKIIFADPEKRLQLENIVHPKILEKVNILLDKLDAPYCIIVIPLLFETKQQDSIDRILVIDTTVEEQVYRTMQRDNISEDYARNIIATQVKRQTRLDNADDIIINSGKLNDLKSQILRLHENYLEISKNK